MQKGSKAFAQRCSMCVCYSFDSQGQRSLLSLAEGGRRKSGPELAVERGFVKAHPSSVRRTPTE